MFLLIDRHPVQCAPEPRPLVPGADSGPHPVHELDMGLGDGCCSPHYTFPAHARSQLCISSSFLSTTSSLQSPGFISVSLHSLSAKPQNNATTLPVLAGKDAVLVARCESAKGQPAGQVFWDTTAAGDQSSTTKLENDNTVSVVSEFRLIPKAADNGKDITCIIKHRAQKTDDIYKMKLAVQYPPTVSISGYDGQWYVGRSNVQLTCVANANPPPTSFEWTVASGQMPKTAQINGNKLSVPKVDESINTTFACEAKNQLGSGQDRVTTLVTGAAFQRVKVDREVQANPGETFQLRCKFEVVQGISLTQVSWVRESSAGRENIAVFHPSLGSNYPDSSLKGRVSFISPSLEDPSISLSDAKTSDSGTYTCEYAIYPSGTEQASSAVFILAKPQNNATTLPVLAGKDAVVVARCESAKGQPAGQVFWDTTAAGDQSNTTKLENDKTVSVVSEFRLIPKAADNGKDITCIIKHRAQKTDDIYKMKLAVQYPPTVSISGYDGQWYVGRSNVQLTCVANANPPPTSFEWTVASGQMPKTAQINGNKLSVPKVDESINTTFACEAKNQLGSGQDRVTTLVTGAAFQRVKVDREVQANPGETFQLRCKFEVVQGISLTQVSWVRESSAGRENIAVFHPSLGSNYPDSSLKGRVSFISPSLEDPSISLSDAKTSDSGTYTCEYAIYPSGTEQASSAVFILAKPQNNATTLPVLAGKDAVVVARCESAKGQPAGQVFWDTTAAGDQSNTTKLENDKTVSVVSEFRLIPKAADNGKDITCIIKHRAQKTDDIYKMKLAVQYPPTVSISGYDGQWYVGRSNVQLTCVANANPPPTSFEWTVASGQMPKTAQINGNKLSVPKVDESINTTFACEAKNQLGSGQDRVTTLVTAEPPTGSSATSSIIGAINILVLAAVNATGLLLYCRRNRLSL
ncbi:hemicentin-2-like isoform X2 [Paramormyrops kingsleyae]|uniref:hemicentin-2-like isoform X2 n=1 Tax=Paramormyrops kingsleyae TaxID=1676925 RepID=UPI003B977BE0